MVKNPFACAECHLVLDDGVEQCPRCPSAPVSTDHQGYVIIINPHRS
ncbi:MAG TPA: DNA-directed RNA polymerase subunit E'', partial [Candidatus Poseidoniaceae archaeon]